MRKTVKDVCRQYKVHNLTLLRSNNKTPEKYLVEDDSGNSHFVHVARLSCGEVSGIQPVGSKSRKTV